MSPPNNPKTPADRTDPEQRWLIGLQRIRTTLRDANEKTDDKDDVTQSLINAMLVATERLLAGVPPQEIALMAAATMVKGFQPQLAAQLQQAWVGINRPPTVPGMPIPTGPSPMGAAVQPQAPTPPMPGPPPGNMSGGGSPPAGL